MNSICHPLFVIAWYMLKMFNEYCKIDATITDIPEIDNFVCGAFSKML